MSWDLKHDTKSLVAGLADLLPAALIIGMCIMLPWGIGKEQGEKAGLESAVKLVRKCESSYRVDGFSSVSSCMKVAIAEEEEAVRQDRLAEGYDDPR